MYLIPTNSSKDGPNSVLREICSGNHNTEMKTWNLTTFSNKEPRRFTFYLCFLYLLTHTGVQHDFPVIWCWCHLTVTRRVTIVERELLTLPENLRSSRVFVGFVLLCYILDLYIYICHMTLDCRWESMWENEINPATLNYKFFWRYQRGNQNS
jgi:hypothetical protein